MKRLIPFLLLLVTSTAFAATSSVSRDPVIPDSPSKLMLVGARTAPTYSMFTAYASVRAGTTKSYHPIPASCDSIVLVWTAVIGGYASPAVYFAGEQAFDNPFEIKASIQTSGGTVIPVWFKGKRLRLVQPGEIVYSDPVAIDLVGGDYINVYTFSSRLASSSYTVASVTSVATGGSTTTLIDTAQTWVTNQWVGYTVNNTTNGTASVITSNTSTTLTFGAVTASIAGNSYNITNLNEVGNLSAAQRSYGTNFSMGGSISGQNEGVYFTTSDGINPFLYDITDAPTNTGFTPPNTNRGFPPVAILGNQVPEDSKATLIVGDSIAYGSGDYLVMSVADQAGFGFIRRALGTSFPNANLAVGGEQFAHWGTGASGYSSIGSGGQARLRGMLLQNARFVIVELGTNDIRNGATLAQTQASAIAMWNRVKLNGAKAFQTTLIPRTTSTDGWMTTANQTTVTTNSFNSIRINFNNWLRDGAPISGGVAVATGTTSAVRIGSRNHPLTGYFEVADTVESSRDSGIFSAPGSAADSGTATGGSTTTIVDSGKSWTVNQWRGYIARNITNGTLSAITSNTATTLTIQTTTTTIATNTYQIIRAMTADGTHPSPYGHELMSAGIDTTRLV